MKQSDAPSKIKVLVVEDHELAREGLRMWLEGIADVELVGMATGMAQAIKLAKLNEPDVVLMDMTLTDGNGLDATQRLGQEVPEARVIILSAHCDGDYVRRALQAGAAGYMLKDLSLDELEGALRAVLAGDFYLSPVASRALAKEQASGARGLDPAETLTERQLQVLKLLAAGRSVKDVGHQLGISPKTVDMHKVRLMQRLKMDNLPSLVRYALQKKLIEL